ncbi:MAG: hypothetical protein LBL09_02635 [Oscillospiraceae bacterium]|nr:hypothetical protein [Oscillospiraceae bacterium]
MALLGCAGFILLFLADYNDFKLKNGPLKLCFPAGIVLLTVSTVILSYKSYTAGGYSVNPQRIIFFAAALFFFLLIIYTLFFAIPAKESYTMPGTGRRVCKAGVYALCRHPGVIWFIFMYVSLCMSVGFPVYCAAVFSALNLLLIVFEDNVVFPALLDGYRGYKEETPFLIPNLDSIKKCVSFYAGAQASKR